MRLRRRFHFPAALLLAALALSSSCGGSDSTSPAPQPVAGPTFNFTYSGAGGSNNVTFPTEGDFAYRCTIHQASGMTGTIFVRANSPKTSQTITVAPGNVWVFSPDTVTVKTGATITFSSGAVTVTHTATRP